MCRQAHIIRAANIIRRSRHHLPKANIIQKSLICPVDKVGFFVGGAMELFSLSRPQHSQSVEQLSSQFFFQIDESLFFTVHIIRFDEAATAAAPIAASAPIVITKHGCHLRLSFFLNSILLLLCFFLSFPILEDIYFGMSLF